MPRVPDLTVFKIKTRISGITPVIFLTHQSQSFCVVLCVFLLFFLHFHFLTILLNLAAAAAAAAAGGGAATSCCLPATVPESCS
jgi:hypothetical protein